MNAGTRGSKKTEPDQPDQPAFGLLQGAWNDFATGRFTKVEILRQLTERGLRTQAGKPLSKQSLDNILADSFYTGNLRDPWSGEEYPGRHFPMVSRVTFAKVQEILGRSPVSVPHKTIRPEFPLRAFARCANCERHLCGSFSRGRSKLYPYYHCFNKMCDLRGNYPLERVHSEFLSFLGEASLDATSLDRMKRCVAHLADSWAAGSRLLGDKRALEIKRLKDQQQQLIRMKMDQLITDEEFVAQRSILVSRQAGLEAQEAEHVVDSDAVLGNIDRICAPLMDLGTAWESVSVEFQRRFQRLALPSGYVFGSVGTAPKGRLFSLLMQPDTSKSTRVPPPGFEPGTISLKGSCSTRLSYRGKGRTCAFVNIMKKRDNFNLSF